jgi:hypothetical protein
VAVREDDFSVEEDRDPVFAGAGNPEDAEGFVTWAFVLRCAPLSRL